MHPNFAHSTVRHLKNLRQSLSQNNKPIGFFLSAGCPLSVFDKEEKEWPLIPDMKGLAYEVKKKISDTDLSPKYELLIKLVEKAKRDHENLENILSYVRTLKDITHGENIHGLEEIDLIKLEEAICKTIVERIDVSLPNKNTPYHKLSRWIKAIDRDKAIEIFTTNYDLLIEQALEESRAPYYDGFVGAKQPFFELKTIEENLAPKHWTRLWKIHGSINWRLTPQKEVSRVTSIDIEDGESHLIYPSHLKYDQSRKMPFLALSDQLSRFLKQPQATLLICGYSFNDEHINDTIINALNSNPSAMVYAFVFGDMKDDKGVDSYPKGINIASLIPNFALWANDEAIIGTTRGEWDKRQEHQEILKEFMISGNDPSKQKVTPELGDFKLLGYFLDYLIGNPQIDD